MQDVVIVAASRTAIGSFQGSLANVAAVDLGAAVIRRLLEQTGLEAAQVDEVILGHVLTAGAGQNTARQAALKAGLPHAVPALTLNKVCGSGLKALHLAAQAIRCGDAEVVIAGGMENMSQAPYVMPAARTGQRMGHGKLIDTMIQDGLWDAFNDYHMGITAENLVDKYAISREEQDAFAAASHAKALAAQAAGHFRTEIAPYTVRVRRPGGADGMARSHERVVDADEGPRADSTPEKLAALKPAFAAHGSVTAGNSSQMSDGAAMLLLASEAALKRYALTPLARFVAYAVTGVAPEVMGIGPVEAIPRVLARAGLRQDDLAWIELNEAFAAQALAVIQALDLDPARVNPLGGAIALGHPLGATGAIRAATLVHGLRRTGGRYGMVSMCVGTGMGAAGLFEAL